ncbi:hypothetical protein [Streptomyces sp. NPDC048710]|uniref:hypothetical protein n=1 Tax=unclassified Streptomyces TaxID=2593676 RepID=UPI00371270E5
MSRSKKLSCVESGPSGRRLGGYEAAVVIVVIVTASTLVLTGVPLIVTLQVLGQAGLLSVVLLGLLTRGGWVARGARMALWALDSPSAR